MSTAAAVYADGIGDPGAGTPVPTVSALPMVSAPPVSDPTGLLSSPSPSPSPSDPTPSDSPSPQQTSADSAASSPADATSVDASTTTNDSVSTSMATGP